MVAPAAMDVFAMGRFGKDAIHQDHEGAAPQRRRLSIHARAQRFGLPASKGPVDAD